MRKLLLILGLILVTLIGLGMWHDKGPWGFIWWFLVPCLVVIAFTLRFPYWPPK